MVPSPPKITVRSAKPAPLSRQISRSYPAALSADTLRSWAPGPRMARAFIQTLETNMEDLGKRLKINSDLLDLAAYAHHKIMWDGDIQRSLGAEFSVDPYGMLLDFPLSIASRISKTRFGKQLVDAHRLLSGIECASPDVSELYGNHWQFVGRFMPLELLYPVVLCLSPGCFRVEVTDDTTREILLGLHWMKGAGGDL